jgi:hypothetical protein
MTLLLHRVERECASAFLAYGEEPTSAAAFERMADLGEAHWLLTELPVLAVVNLQLALDAPPELKPAAQAVAMACGLGLWLRPWRPCEPPPADRRPLERLRVLARVLGAGPGPADCELEAELAPYGAVELLSWCVPPDAILSALQLRPIVLAVLRRP